MKTLKTKIDYALIIKNKTRLELLIEKFNTQEQARFYIESLGGSFLEYKQEHDTFYQALEKVQKKLAQVLKYKIIERSYLPSYLFSSNNMIIVVGQDGLVANTAKYSGNIPIIGVNPDPERYDGVLLSFTPDNFIIAVKQVIEMNYSSKKIHLAEAKLSDGQRLLAFNDLFIGAVSHTSARYKIIHNEQVEEQSSSGIIVSTPMGATAWMSSVFTMAYGIARWQQPDLEIQPFKPKEDQLLFAVREPFKSVRTQTGITIGVLDKSNRLRIESLMPTRGIIFSDGIEVDFMNFNSGAVVSIGIAEETANLVINT